MSGIQRVAWWGLLSSAGALVLLVGGWTLAARLQPAGFDSVSDTISALAGRGASSRWVMTLALAGVGVCYMVTALALVPAPDAGRWVLGAGGVATVLVAAFPLPAVGTSTRHAVAAGVGFVCLAVWPLLGRHMASNVWTLRWPASIAAAGVLLGLLAWFAVELSRDSARVGLSERAAAAAQALWPLIVVVTAFGRQ